jgi:hypothetical protein
MSFIFDSINLTENKARLIGNNGGADVYVKVLDLSKNDLLGDAQIPKKRISSFHFYNEINHLFTGVF